MTKRLVLLVATMILTARRWAVADAPASDQKSPETKAIVQTTQAMAKAFNEGDGKALAGLWSEGGVYVSHDTGERVKGRSNIAKIYVDYFKQKKGAHIDIGIDALHLTTPEVAVLDGSAQVRRSSEPIKDAHFSMVLVKSNGRWL